MTRREDDETVRSGGVRGGRLGRRIGLATSLGLLAMAGGCGQSLNSTTYAVDGQVLLAPGKPLTGGQITLVPNTSEGAVRPASGEIGPDGKFTLTTDKSGDGANVGDYRVRIVPAPGTPIATARKPGFPGKYSDVDSSGLEVTIKPEANHLPPFILK